MVILVNCLSQGHVCVLSPFLIFKPYANARIAGSENKWVVARLIGRPFSLTTAQALWYKIISLRSFLNSAGMKKRYSSGFLKTSGLDSPFVLFILDALYVCYPHRRHWFHKSRLYVWPRRTEKTSPCGPLWFKVVSRLSRESGACQKPSYSPYSPNI